MEDVRASAQVMLVDAIRHGTTTLIDHHASPNAIEGSLDVIAEAVDAIRPAGRAVLRSHRPGWPGEGHWRASQENVRFIERCRREQVAGGRVAATFGLHASLTLSDATLDACRQAAPSRPASTSMSPNTSQTNTTAWPNPALRVVDRLNRHGILGPQTIVAHAVHIDPREAGLLAEAGPGSRTSRART